MIQSVPIVQNRYFSKKQRFCFYPIHLLRLRQVHHILRYPFTLATIVQILDTIYKRWREPNKLFSWSHKLKQNSIRQITAFIESSKPHHWQDR